MDVDEKEQINKTPLRFTIMSKVYHNISNSKRRRGGVVGDLLLPRSK